MLGLTFSLKLMKPASIVIPSVTPRKLLPISQSTSKIARRGTESGQERVPDVEVELGIVIRPHRHRGHRQSGEKKRAHRQSNDYATSVRTLTPQYDPSPKCRSEYYFVPVFPGVIPDLSVGRRRPGSGRRRVP